jgi:hypothetical protein
MSETNERSDGSIGSIANPLAAAVARLRRDGHDDEADGLIAVDHLMREYAYTADPLDAVAEAMAKELRDVVGSWTKTRPADGRIPIEVAKRRGVCRLCGEPAEPRRIDGRVDAFVLDFGREFAHESCLGRGGK